MSHKKAKAERKAAPKIEHQLVINCYSDGNLEVTNLPKNYDTGMQIINAAQLSIHRHYIGLAVNGQLDKFGNVIPAPVKADDVAPAEEAKAEGEATNGEE
jgi:hypothetical protein